jgi:glycosyltransferase involved in cell wall biosynthesis
MRVLLLSRYDRHGASSRLRHEQFLPYLAAAGIKVRTAPFLPDDYLEALYAGRSRPFFTLIGRYLQRAGLRAAAARADLIWVEKEVFPWLPLCADRLLLPVGIPTVLDYDDAWFLRYRLHRFAPVRALLGDKLDRLMASARLVTVGNRRLAEHARAAGAAWVETLPTVLDVDRYPVVAPAPADGGPPVVGWIGTPATAGYLQGVAAQLNRLSTAGRIRVRVVGAASVPGLNAECVPWSEATEARSVAAFDIGIMPLPDNDWERGKCAYKLIQCMACGKPVVASPVGANCDVVTAGETGFLPVAPAEWETALGILADDFNLRRRFGLAGRAVVEARYSLQGTAPRLIELLRRAAAT